MKLRLAIALSLLAAACNAAKPPRNEQDVAQDRPVKESVKTVKTETQWRAALTPEAYSVLREKGTERAFSGEYVHAKEPGVYRCAACAQDLFDAKHQFDSGSGWPSFSDVVDKGVVLMREDRNLATVRTEVLCARCESHLGHLFADGPPPTGLRYCINSVALSLRPEKVGAPNGR